MIRKVLWLEDEPVHVRAQVEKLRSNGYEAKVVQTLLKARDLLNAEDFDLLILDVMVPATNDQEERVFPTIKTDSGLSAGLYFYKHMKLRLEETKTKVLVYTNRREEEIRNAFYELDLPKNNFATKLELRDVHDFLARVRELFGD